MVLDLVCSGVLKMGRVPEDVGRDSLQALGRRLVQPVQMSPPDGSNQIATSQTGPHGKVVGVDVLSTTPIEGVTAMQGDFMVPAMQDKIKSVLRTATEACPRPEQPAGACREASTPEAADTAAQEPLQSPPRSNIGSSDAVPARLVDVVLSDMSEIPLFPFLVS